MERRRRRAVGRDFQKANAVDVFGRLEGDDVPVIQVGDSARFTVEAFEAARIVCDFGREYLERDVASES